MIERVFDADVGIIYVTGTGSWTRQAVDDHYCALRRLIDGLRAQGLPIRVLSDVTGAQRQDPALERHILSQIGATFREGDRFAVLTANMAEKAYTVGVVGRAQVAVFASRIPAEQWLLLDEISAAS